MIKIIIAIAVRNSENEQTLIKLVAEGVLSNIYRFSGSVDEGSAKKLSTKTWVLRPLVRAEQKDTTVLRKSAPKLPREKRRFSRSRKR
jgi:hypothetical protein